MRFNGSIKISRFPISIKQRKRATNTLIAVLCLYFHMSHQFPLFSSLSHPNRILQAHLSNREREMARSSCWLRSFCQLYTYESVIDEISFYSLACKPLSLPLIFTIPMETSVSGDTYYSNARPRLQIVECVMCFF